jgi:hypothetical protein
MAVKFLKTNYIGDCNGVFDEVKECQKNLTTKEYITLAFENAQDLEDWINSIKDGSTPAPSPTPIDTRTKLEKEIDYIKENKLTFSQIASRYRKNDNNNDPDVVSTIEVAEAVGANTRRPNGKYLTEKDIAKNIVAVIGY